MLLWGLNQGRFIPWLATMDLAAMGIALVPVIASRLVRPIEWLGDLSLRDPWRARAVWAVLGAGLVLALPDRTHFTGDFVLREFAIRTGGSPSELFPQALPADVWLHYSLPRWLATARVCSAAMAARVLGGMEAAMLAIVGVELSRILRLTGVASCVAAAALLFGPQLAMMTGYAKALSELAVCAAVMGVLAIRVVSEGRGVFPLSVALGVALLLHRSAVLFLPAYFAFLIMTRGLLGKSPRTLLAAAVAPAIALCVAGPRIVRTLSSFDLHAGHFGVSGLNELALNGLDLINMLLMMPVLILGLAGTRIRGLRIPVWTWMTIPLLPAIGIGHFAQGLFRDWDLFIPSLVLLSVLAAAQVSSIVMKLERPQRWIGPCILMSLACPPVIALAEQADLQAGMKRAEAFATESPTRSPDVRGKVWTFLSDRWVQLENYREAVRTARAAAELTPTRSVLLLLAGSERNVGDHSAALATYRRLLRVDPRNDEGWYCVALYSADAGDFDQADDALRKLSALPISRDIVAYAASRIERARARHISSRTDRFPSGP